MCFTWLIFSRNIPKKEAVFKVFCFFFKSFVAVTHNAVNGLYIVSSGDVKQSLFWMKECLLHCNVVAKNQRKASPLHAQREALHRITLEPNLSTCCLARMWSTTLCSYASFLSTKIDAFHWVRVNQNSLLCKGYWILWWKKGLLLAYCLLLSLTLHLTVLSHSSLFCLFVSIDCRCCLFQWTLINKFLSKVLSILLSFFSCQVCCELSLCYSDGHLLPVNKDSMQSL